MKFLKIILLTVIFSTAAYAAEKPVNNENVAAQKSASNDSNDVVAEKPYVTVTPAHPTFTIKLKSNATTGYTWFLRDYDKTLIEPVSHKYEHATSQLVGAPGYQLWTFKVKPAGFTVPQVTYVQLIYSRPWETTDQTEAMKFKVSTVSK